jgi:hypothetical protein
MSGQASPDDRHEESGQLFQAALWSAGGLLALLALLYAVLWLPFRHPEAGTETRLEELRRLPAGTSAPGTEGAEASDYGWVDRGAGIVRIPVDEAMKVVAERLPVRPLAAKARGERARRQVPTDAGSGRYPRRGEER